MIEGQGLTIKPWTNPKELPNGYRWKDSGLRVEFKDAPDAMHKAYPYYQEEVWYHAPTKALWFPICEEGK